MFFRDSFLKEYVSSLETIIPMSIMNSGEIYSEANVRVCPCTPETLRALRLILGEDRLVE